MPFTYHDSAGEIQRQKIRNICRATLILYLLILGLVLSGCGKNARRPQAVNGLLDLSNWDFAEDGIVSLNGQWEFYWGRLLNPGDFDDKKPPKMTGYLNVPGSWRGYDTGEKILKGEGVATFRLYLRIKPEKTSKAIRISEISSAYVLWVNGSKVDSSGIVGNSIESETPYKTIKISHFNHKTDIVEVILQVSNHNYRFGGIQAPIWFGHERHIRRDQNIMSAFAIFLISSFIVIGLYNILCICFVLKMSQPFTSVRIASYGGSIPCAQA